MTVPAPDRPSAQRAVIHVHGPALRLFREMLGRKPAELAAALECDRSYVTRLELGHARTCSRAFYSRLIAELALPDRRVLLACPYGGEPHEQRWNPDSDEDTVILERPEIGGAPAGDVEVPIQGKGRHRAGRPAVRT